MVGEREERSHLLSGKDGLLLGGWDVVNQPHDGFVAMTIPLHVFQVIVPFHLANRQR